MFEKFEKVEDLNILVIGDIILDTYIHGDTHRISPEAPVPVVLTRNKSHVPGGAANVATNLTSLGAKVYLMGFVGNDNNGDLVTQLVEKVIYDGKSIFKTEQITTTKTRVVSKGQQMIRIDDENVSHYSTLEEEMFINKLSDILNSNSISGIVLQDYNKGLFSAFIIKSVIDIAQSQQIPFFVDPKHDNFWEFKGATLFKPNLSELKKANESDDTIHLDEMLIRTASDLNCELLICTLAEDGIALVKNGEIFYSPTQKIDVLDVSGAGDTALSIMVIAYLLGYNSDEIAQLANICGKVVCMKSGVSTITIQELKDAYYSNAEDILK